MKKVTLKIDQKLYQDLYSHLFQEDNDEHGAVIAAGIAESPSEVRLLAKKVFLAKDGIDYVPGTRGYRALNSRFVAEKISFCEEEKLCYLAVHCHPGHGTAAFSLDDMNSHLRGYPALLDINSGLPVGALVFTKDHIAGDIWFNKDTRINLNKTTVIGPHVFDIFENEHLTDSYADPIYDRHALLFGSVGQDKLRNLKVGVVGAGGAGSILCELLSRLGVGEIILIDYDKIEPSNLPRIVGASYWDAKVWFAKSNNVLLNKLGKLFSIHKVDIAKRLAKQANPNIKFSAIKGDILDPENAKILTDCDFLFLAADSMQAKLLFNRIVFQYLIPGIQVGAKISVDNTTRKINNIFTATRPVLPYPGGGCLSCTNCISPSKLQEEALTEKEKLAQKYINDAEVHAPSVITLNSLSVSQAVNDFLMIMMGLFNKNVSPTHILNFVQERTIEEVDQTSNPDCRTCSNMDSSYHARGDQASLPVRQQRKKTLWQNLQQVFN